MVTVFTFTPTFSSTRNGTPVLDIGDNRYYKNNRSKGPKATWFCNFIYTHTRYGKPAIQMGKYRFYRNNRSTDIRSLWICCRNSMGCRATITTFKDIVIKQKCVHNH
ncbi:hypothetical protein SFRURICE_012649 [Spodoptera frugiperda]|nr:hypothetical protein SFRURICE_012649 [Spodoptera frugiperda]